MKDRPIVRQSQRGDWIPRVLVIGLLIITITALHYGIDTGLGAVHDILLRAYYIPIVLGGLWFGTRGGLLAALGVTIVFLPHALHGWDAPYTSIFRLIEIMMYYVIGGITGWMSSRARRALLAEQIAGRERRKAHEALRAKTTRLFEMEEELRRSESLAALGTMSGGLAHEIRNPLSSIKTSAELLRDRCRRGEKSPPEDSTELLEIIIEESERLNRVLTEFLLFARAEIRETPALAENCNLAEILGGSISVLRHEVDEAQLRISVGEDALDFRVAMAGDHLHQVFLNLLLNARDAMSQGGGIRIGLEEEKPESIRLFFEDDGPGISAEDARRIFDPFFTTRAEGVGLGLSIVARLLEASGGGISVDREYSSGARFLLSLPKSAS